MILQEESQVKIKCNLLVRFPGAGYQAKQNQIIYFTSSKKKKPGLTNNFSVLIIV